MPFVPNVPLFLQTVNNSFYFPLKRKEMKEFKRISISAYLANKGINPVKEINGQLLYFSPFSNEKTPSFYLDIKKNVFFDFSSNFKGDIIDIVQNLENKTFKETLEFLETQNFKNSFSFSGKIEKSDARGIRINEILEIKNEQLKKYIQSRCIDFDLAVLYLKEIHYSVNDKNYFAIGFKNDIGGFELRNGLGFKGKTQNAVTTLENNSKCISIFEGFFDFLSALQFYRLNKPNNTTIVLNTTNNLTSILPHLKYFNKIYSFLDNDNSGLLAYSKLVRYKENAVNKSFEMYPNHKDFNHFLVSERFNKS